MKIFNFDNSYSRLSEVFFADVQPTPCEAPQLVLWNEDLAKELEIDISKISQEELSNFFSGTKIFPDTRPLAMAYAGHQFGHFTMLGDGRAILLGEHITSASFRFDIQLKGSGRTPFSRGGDGRATLRAMLREYLISECMFALGIPTSRSLAIVKTGIPVNRETVHEGAVLTRVMDSHLRVGTIEFARHYLNVTQQKELLDYAISRHFPEIKNSANRGLDFLKSVQQKQLELMVHWMRIGFIHGVMNTDNMHLGGQTFDYGPCAFMNAYDPKTVFSSIDTQGRYAYGNQPEIALWNLSVLAGALLPLISEDQETAVELAKNCLNTFAQDYRLAWRKMMCAKIGFSEQNHSELALLDRLLDWMTTNKSDYTNTFLVISGDLPDIELADDDILKRWKIDWKTHHEQQNTWVEAQTLMKVNNPQVIPRNYLVEKALDEATLQGDYMLFNNILLAVKSPEKVENLRFFQNPPIDSDHGYKTFCGT